MKKTERKTKRPTTRTATAAAEAPKVEATKKKPIVEPADNLSLSEIKQLIDLIAEKQFNEFELVRGDFKLRLMKGTSQATTVAVVAEAPQVIEQRFIPAPVIASAPAPAPSVVESVAPAPTPAPQEENLHIVTSPIVGTFYRSPSPTAAVFVNIGDSVEEGKVLCIIEAMKLMNEIPSDASGRIEKIFVENGQPVEYGQPLFGIKK
ncbi:MAG TPA: acetyl-CoA carboxylase biotin carboxyl carrier protein [Blastocatellia bacterium]|nr:acetyl-CoA carboxylase biotin carboxyl carrier protein [Blastocatellia bacterium]HMV85152.1 acetyl-CoA carboxylase biotin carboxyl carrier protein [Blastocatellia bacterium]HMX26465.1 acetyl-CoA carboxylase biotin carboxyl carrier protein [Blastocatellia bacterium]HMY74104.1 acetyl-CoA carboxylase biotin carboxyl carrier protein [Blastocatellia bacterium]HMZ18601.1 acetyl-CoA carboxylase biotin carboxyl carrier protein [Blastocatellia bacterium]